MKIHTKDKNPVFFTTEELGPKQSLTPEGFLLCSDVPIGRLGTLQYLPEEVGIIGGPDGIVHVSRDADTLFSPATLASFEGKPVTLDHPPGPVTPANWSLFAVGTVQRVRRGVGPQIDLMVADLLITVSEVIDAIRKKEILEVSSGYDCDYEQISPGLGRQLDIIGNHVALVDKGRCGPRCAIGDKAMVKRVLTTSLRKKLARSTAMDKLIAAIQTKDEEAGKMALAEVISGDEDPDEGGDLHLHLSGIGPDEESPDLSGLMDAVGELAARMDDMESVTGDAAMDSRMKDGRMKDSYKRARDKRAADRKARDEAEAKKKEEEEKAAADKKMRDLAEGKNPEDDDGDGNTRDRQSVTDSSSLREVFQKTISNAEILHPGIKLQTFDAKANYKLTVDALCALRRRALGNAVKDDKMLEIVVGLTGRTPDLKAMTCDQVATMFDGAAELIKQFNAMDQNRGGPKVERVGAMTFGQQKVPTIAEINARNSKAWAASRT